MSGTNWEYDMHYQEGQLWQSKHQTKYHPMWPTMVLFTIIGKDWRPFSAISKRFIEVIETSSTPDSPVVEFLNQNPIGMARVSSDVATTPFHMDRILDHAKSEVFLVGQNLYSLAKSPYMRRKIFEWLTS